MANSLQFRVSRLERTNAPHRARFICVSGMTNEGDARAYLESEGIVVASDDLLILEPGPIGVELIPSSHSQEDALALLSVEEKHASLLNSIKGNRHVGNP